MIPDVQIFDLDGTIWMPADTPLCLSEDRLTHPMWAQHAEDYRLLPGVAEAISRMSSQGSEIVVCTNQGGLPWNVEQGRKCAAKGRPFKPYKTLPHFYQEMNFLRSLLPAIGHIWVSPGVETGIILVGKPCGNYRFKLMKQECHKPAPTMLLDIWKQYPNSSSFRFWGDRESDRLAAINAAAKGMPVFFEWAHSLESYL